MAADFGSVAVRDVQAFEAFDGLRSDPHAQLIDVRSRAEWNLVGVPDLSGLSKAAILIEWQTWPDMAPAADFLGALNAALADRGVGQEAPLYFLCRSGVRSLAAAEAATRAGFGQSFNVAGGFEGPPDGSRHRGSVAGWKAANLPWVQS